MSTIMIKTDDGVLHFPLAPDGWRTMLDWDERYGYQTGIVYIGEFKWQWDSRWDKQYDPPKDLPNALLCAVEACLSTKPFVDDPRACDDPYSVFHQIPETLRMRSILGETPHSFVELVRWASHDVR